MKETSMKLYVDKRLTSPYALSVFVTLKEKRIPFELEYVELEVGAQHARGYAQLSRTCRIPTLLIDGFSVSESSAITEYLEDTRPSPPVYPADAMKKAVARQVQAWLRSDLMPIREERSTEHLYYRSAVQPLTPSATAAANKLVFAAESLLAHGQENLLGDWCIADVDLALMLNRLLHNGYPLPDGLAQYTRKQWSRPSVAEWVALPRPGGESL